MRLFSTVIGVSDRILKLSLIALLALLVICVSWQVITRFLMPEPSSVTEELARFILIWVGLLGAALAYRERMHLGIDYLTSKLQGKKQLCAQLGVHLVSAIFSIVVMVVGGWRLVELTLDLNQSSPSLGVMMGYVYLALPLSGGLIFMYSLFFAATDLGLMRDREITTRSDSSPLPTPVDIKG